MASKAKNVAAAAVVMASGDPAVELGADAPLPGVEGGLEDGGAASEAAVSDAPTSDIPHPTSDIESAPVDPQNDPVYLRQRIATLEAELLAKGSTDGVELTAEQFDANIKDRIAAIRLMAGQQAARLKGVAGMLPADPEAPEAKLGTTEEPNELEVLERLMAQIDDPELVMVEAGQRRNACRADREEVDRRLRAEERVAETAFREAREVRQNGLVVFEKAKARVEYLRAHRGG